MKRRTVILGGVALINLGATVTLQLFLLKYLGVGGATDAFFAASTLPQLVLAILIGSAVNVVVPFFSGRTLGVDFSADAWSVLCWTFTVLAVAGIGIAVAARPLTSLLLPGLSVGDQALAMQLTQVAAVGLPCGGLVLMAAAIHQGLGHYVRAETIAASTSVALLGAAMLALPVVGLVGVAWLFVARSILQTILLLPGLGTPSLELSRPAARTILVGMRPLLVGTSYFKLAPLLDRWLASLGSAGDISLLHLLQQIFAAIAALFGKSIVEPLVGSLATDRKTGVTPAARVKRYKVTHRTVAVLSISAYLLTLLIVSMLPATILPTALARRLLPLILALGGLYTAGFLGQLAAAWCYAEGNTRDPARVGAMGFTVGIALRAVLVPLIGTPGIAAATSATQIFNWLMLNRPIIKGAVDQ